MAEKEKRGMFRIRGVEEERGIVAGEITNNKRDRE